MALADWLGVITAVGVLSGIAFAVGRAINGKLSHIDKCVDEARKETQAGLAQSKEALYLQQEKVREELKQEQAATQLRLEKVRADLLVEQERTRGEITAAHAELLARQREFSQELAARGRRIEAIESSMAWIAGKLGIDGPVPLPIPRES